MNTAIRHFWKPLFVIAGCLLQAASCSAQGVFNKAFWYEEIMGNLEPVSGPSGYLICSTIRYNGGLTDGFQFTQFDSVGNVMQTRAFSAGPIVNVMQDGALAQARSDGSLAFLFGSHTYNGGYLPSWRVFNTTAQGAVNWNRQIQYANSSYAFSFAGAMDQAFQETPNDGYLITGLRTTTADSSAPVVMKLDGLGNILWNKTYYLDQPHAWHIASHIDQNGTTLLGFHTDSVLQIASDNCIVTRIDPDGSTLWSKRIMGFEGLLTGCVKMDEGYAISAEDSTSMYILVMDTAGIALWGRRYTFNFQLSTWGAGIIPTRDHGFVLRKLVPDSIGGYNTFFFKVDSSGVLQWERLYGNGLQYPIDLVENKDSTFAMLSLGELGFVLSGLDPTGLNQCITPVTGWLTPATLSFSLVDVSLNEFSPPMISQPLYVNDSTASDPQMLDLCLFEVGIADLGRADELLIYPNPSNGRIVIKARDHLMGTTLSFFDTTGRTVKIAQLNSRETIVDLGPLPSGIYLYRSEIGTKVLSGKIVVE